MGAGAFEYLVVAEEAGAVEVDVSMVQQHGPAPGKLLGFVEVRQRQLRLACTARSQKSPNGASAQGSRLSRSGYLGKGIQTN